MATAEEDEGPDSSLKGASPDGDFPSDSSETVAAGHLMVRFPILLINLRTFMKMKATNAASDSTITASILPSTMTLTLDFRLMR